MLLYSCAAVDKISTDNASRGPSALAELFVIHVTWPSIGPWRRWDTLFTSGFVDDVMFAYNGQE